MRCAQHFNLSHWTPQLVKYLLCSAPATDSIQAIDSKQMHLTCWRFRWPWQCASTVPSASTNASCSALQFKPLNAATGQVFTPYRPGDRQGPIQAIDCKQMHLTCWKFQWPWWCASTVPSTSTCSALQFKPLDTAIGQIFALYFPEDRQGPIQISKTNASHLLEISMAMTMRQCGTKRIDACIVISASI